MIETSLSVFFVRMHSGKCEKYIQFLSLRPRDWDFLFTHALVHFLTMKTIQHQAKSLLEEIEGLV